jgi:hypothetical protein
MFNVNTIYDLRTVRKVSSATRDLLGLFPLHKQLVYSNSLHHAYFSSLVELSGMCWGNNAAQLYQNGLDKPDNTLSLFHLSRHFTLVNQLPT